MDTLTKGNTWRRAVVLLLEQSGIFPSVRGIGYKGDDLQWGRFSIEAKNVKRTDLAGFLDQAISNCPAGSIPVVALKRRGRSSAAEGYAVMRISDLVRLMEAYDGHP